MTTWHRFIRWNPNIDEDTAEYNEQTAHDAHGNALVTIYSDRDGRTWRMVLADEDTVMEAESLETARIEALDSLVVAQ